MTPERTCPVCGRRTEHEGDSVRHCSAGCRRRGLTELDRRLEAAVTDLLASRSGTICPSDAARRVDASGWRELMEPARMAAMRLVAAGEVEIVQGGRVVDPPTAKGPIRIRRAR